MWVFLNDAFLSIVADPHSDKLLVRARLPGDIEQTFPEAEVIEGAGTDYRFRAWINREAVADTLHQQVLRIDYNNFKASVKDHSRHDTYMDVWEVMYRAQKQAQRHTREL